MSQLLNIIIVCVVCFWLVFQQGGVSSVHGFLIRTTSATTRITTTAATTTCHYPQWRPAAVAAAAAAPVVALAMHKRLLPSPQVDVLSTDPLVYVIPNFLSRKECEDYINYVRSLETETNRIMTRSNPPEVSLDKSKLWPLPFLSLLAGIPPLIKMDLSTSIPIDDLQTTVLPPIAIALCLSVVLVMGAVPFVQQFMSQQARRTSDAMALNLNEDIEFVTALVDRVEEATQHPWSKWEAPVATRYAPGAIFAKHGDASPTKGSEWQDEGGQRVITCICYLNSLGTDGGSGGETAFDRLNIKVTPQQGKALFFFPANEETLEADDRTIHESLPPMEEKWIVQMFGRIGPRVPPPLGLPDAYRSFSS